MPTDGVQAEFGFSADEITTLEQNWNALRRPTLLFGVPVIPVYVLFTIAGIAGEDDLDAMANSHKGSRVNIGSSNRVSRPADRPC
jgi:hypothetical protein